MQTETSPSLLPVPARSGPLLFGPWRWLLLAAGWLALLLGVIGVVLPIMPTAPFLIVAAACFSRSSPVMRDALYRLPLAGKFLRDWQDGETISPALKWTALAALWVTAFWMLIGVAKTALVKTLVLGMTLLASLVLLARPDRRKSG